jgi:neutral ceramidase
LPKEDFPHILFLKEIRVADMLLIPLPFEVTTKAGRRIASRCRERSPGMKDDMYTVLSVSNGYCGYVTMPEEYAQQQYG